VWRSRVLVGGSERRGPGWEAMSPMGGGVHKDPQMGKGWIKDLSLKRGPAGAEEAKVEKPASEHNIPLSAGRISREKRAKISRKEVKFRRSGKTRDLWRHPRTVKSQEGPKRLSLLMGERLRKTSERERREISTTTIPILVGKKGNIFGDMQNGNYKLGE